MSKANLANATLASAINTTATTATLATGYGASMPPLPFKLTVTPFGQLPTMGNSEVWLVTARTSDTLTIQRAKNNTTAKAFEAGAIVTNGVYAEATPCVGDIVMSLRATAPLGRLFMDGRTYNKADYPLLYQHVVDNPAYGTTGGSVGSETFTLADMRERMPFGKSPNSPFTTLGVTGGSTAKTLTQAQIPVFTGTFNHQAGGEGASTGIVSNVGGYPAVNEGSSQSVQVTTRRRIQFGGGQSHDVMNPYITVNYEVVAG